MSKSEVTAEQMGETTPDHFGEGLMVKKIKRRLAELRQERAKGQIILVKKQNELDELNSSLLRISGASQVLEELLQEATVEKRGEEAGDDNNND